jgi:hypothetical protein
MKPKNLLTKIFTLLIVAGLMNLNVFSYVISNGAGTGYTNNDNGNTGGIQEYVDIHNDKTIEMYIVEGSGYYMGAVANINYILQLYEVHDLNGIDFYRFNRQLDQALINMDKAITSYETLIMKAESTPYNKEVLEKLAGFDYYAFMTENRLNKDIFQQVEGYLEPGCITGVFKHTLENFLNIKRLLESIKSPASVNRLPDVDIMWQLNEKCLETSYFGSFVARVFQEINN